MGDYTKIDITDERIEYIADRIHELTDYLNLSDDDVIDLSVGLLYLVLQAIPDNHLDINFKLSDEDINILNEPSKKIKEYIIDFIGDTEKTIAFIESELHKIGYINNNNRGVA